MATSCEENARLREALFRANLALNKFEVQGDEEEKDEEEEVEKEKDKEEEEDR